MTDADFDRLFDRLSELGVSMSNHRYYVERLREKRDALHALCPLRPGALARIAREVTRSEWITGEAWRVAPGEIVAVISVGYDAQQRRHVVSVVYPCDRYQEHGTGYWRRTREASRYSYSLWADGLVLYAGSIPDPWAGCACVDDRSCGCGTYGWHRHAVCAMHPLTPEKPGAAVPKETR